MWDQLNSFTKQIAEQASQAVKDAGIEKQLENVGQHMAGGLDKLANSVLTTELPSDAQDQTTSRPRQLLNASHQSDEAFAGIRGTAPRQMDMDQMDPPRETKSPAEEENLLLKQRLSAVEAAATEALGELEESQEKLEVANQRRSRAEQDLQKAKREISKLRKNLNVSQQNLDAKSSELLATAVELEHLKSAQSNHDHGRLEMDDKVDNAGQAEHMVEQIEANRNLVTSLKEKDEELNSLRKVLAERDEQIASNLSKAADLADELKSLKASHEKQHQNTKRQGKELAKVSKKLSYAVTSVDEKKQEIKLTASLIQKLEETVNNLSSQAEKFCEYSCSSLEEGTQEIQSTERSLEAHRELVRLQINVHGDTPEAGKVTTSDADKALLESIKSDNESLKCELASCQNELEVLVESSRELEAAVASKDTELIALRHGTKAEFNLCTEKLKDAKDQCSALEDHISELESQASRWEGMNRELGFELKCAQERCKALEDNAKGLQDSLDNEKTQNQNLRIKHQEEMSGEMEARERAVRNEELMKAENREKSIRAEKEELVQKLGELQNELDVMRPMKEQIGELEATINCLETELREVKETLSGKEVELTAVCQERTQLQKSLDSEIASGEDRRRKFVMVQAAFKTKEEALNNEILELQAEVAQLIADTNAAKDELEEKASELEEFQKSQGALIKSSEELNARCVLLETEVSTHQKASSEAVSKLQAVQYTLETTQREKEATIGELKASERHLRERVTSAETRAQEIDQKLVSMDADLVESSSNARSAEARMKAAEAQLAEAEARALAAEQSKIAMTLAMAEMEDSARDTGESEIQQACPSSVQGVEDLSADVEALKSQLALAEEESKQLRWQIRMMMDASKQEDKGKSATSWIMGCVSNRK